MSATQNVIEVRGLVNRFGSQTVHDRLDLDVHRGEILGVIGGSGSGKSVLLRTITGLRAPTAGSAKVFGVDLSKCGDAQRREVGSRIGLLFQEGALFSSLTVAENVAVPLKERHALPAELLDKLVRLKIRLAGLPDGAANKYPAQLSGGMRKRAGLARALALDPEALFLDEPTAGLDPIGASRFDELLRTLCRALGLTVFLVTHDLDTLHAVCDRVAVLAEGKVIVIDTLDAVARFDHPWVQDYFGGPRGRAALRGNPGGQGEH